jgi:hypothetical protein
MCMCKLSAEATSLHMHYRWRQATMKETELIIGENVQSLQILEWVDDEHEKNSIEKVLFHFDSFKMLIEIQDSDELTLVIEGDLKLEIENENYRIIDITQDSNTELKKCLNKKLIWLWELKNNKGYDDGIQVELSNHIERIRIQFLAESSFISILELNEMK